MKYKLLVLDIDGTLTNSQKEISPLTLEVILKAQEKGLKVILASGRPTYGIVPLANQLQLQHYGGFILAYNGGLILNWTTQEILHEKKLPNDVIPYLYQCAKESNTTILSYKDEFVLTENPEDQYVQYELHLNKMEAIKSDNFLDDIPLHVPKCLIVGDPEIIVQLEEKIQKAIGDQIEVYRSEPFFLELVPKGIDKATSLAHLLAEIEIDREEMIACGDGFNDLSMIKYAGLGVAMLNGQEIVRQNADFIAPSNDDNGVAKVVEKFYLSAL